MSILYNLTSHCRPSVHILFTAIVEAFVSRCALKGGVTPCRIELNGRLTYRYSAK